MEQVLDAASAASERILRQVEALVVRGPPRPSTENQNQITAFLSRGAAFYVGIVRPGFPVCLTDAAMPAAAWTHGRIIQLHHMPCRIVLDHRR